MVVIMILKLSLGYILFPSGEAGLPAKTMSSNSGIEGHMKYALDMKSWKRSQASSPRISVCRLSFLHIPPIHPMSRGISHVQSKINIVEVNAIGLNKTLEHQKINLYEGKYNGAIKVGRISTF